MLLVDAAQGIEAQTLANCYLALEHDLEIVACLNKIDLPAAEPDRYAAEIEQVLGIPADEILRISAKTGEGVPELLDAVIERIPAPIGDPDAPLQALIFDSHFDQYRGVVSLGPGHERHAARPAPGSGSCRPARRTTPTRSACARPSPPRSPALGPGEVGYLIAGIKDVGEARSGETVTEAVPAGRRAARRATATRSRWCSAGCTRSTATSSPTCGRRSRSCGSTTPASPTSPRRPARSASASAAASSACCTWRSSGSGSSASSTCASSPPRPSVEYHGRTRPRATWSRSTTRASMPPPQEIESIEEPWLSGHHPHARREYTGTLMDLCQTRRGEMEKIEYLSPERVELRYRMPLAEVVIDFFDQLKSRTQGYASLDYEPAGYAGSNLVKVDVLLNAAAGRRVQHDRAPGQGRRVRPAHDREAAGAHPAPDVRRARSRRRSAAGSSPARP